MNSTHLCLHRTHKLELLDQLDLFLAPPFFKDTVRMRYILTDTHLRDRPNQADLAEKNAPDHIVTKEKKKPHARQGGIEPHIVSQPD